MNLRTQTDEATGNKNLAQFAGFEARKISIKPVDKEFINMREITVRDYEEFVKSQRKLVFNETIGKRNVSIEIGKDWKIPQSKLQPTNFELEGTTLWSYPQRGDWATHKGDYRGNWPPQMVRNIILRYSEPRDLVLDQMCGSGTTLVECRLTGRNALGVDINPDCIMLTRDRLNFKLPDDGEYSSEYLETFQRTFVGDARNLDLISKGGAFSCVDLIATHPPYANIIPYSREGLKGDLSYVNSIDEFIEQMFLVARECYRVLKSGGFCAIIVGDTRRNKHYVPIAFRTMQAFLNEGFILKEDVIKHQWRCKSTGFWLKKSVENNFLLIMHEHLFIFRKPSEDENLGKYRESLKWWS